MLKMELVKVMSKYQKAQFLKTIKKGGSNILDDWLMEGLQDGGYIDHKNNITPLGEEILASSEKHDVEDGIA